MKGTIWVDLLNPSHPLFFEPVVQYLKSKYDITVTIRERGETIQIAKKLGLTGKIIGQDYENAFMKTLAVSIRTCNLAMSLKGFDTALSFENPMSVAVGNFRRKRTILMLDNDLKYKGRSGLVQRLESRLKTWADVIIVPKCTEKTLGKHFTRSLIHTYEGYKEDIYIASHRPDPSVIEDIPFDKYVVIRPEAFSSFYVGEGRSLVPPLIERFEKEGIDVVYLPRDQSDREVMRRKNVYVPPAPLNGLDLIHYSSGVLTGSGTMAREGAIMGKKAVSFFPGTELLSVDSDLIKKGRMIHSRNIDHIINIIQEKSRKQMGDHESSVIQKEFFNKLDTALGG